MTVIDEPLALRCSDLPGVPGYTVAMDDEVSALGQARAGAAFANRRVELGITQRELARLGIITASSLIAFEKGRAWPRERTRATLEELAHWPAGTLATIRAGGAIPGAHASRPAPPVDGPLVVEAVHVAMRTIDVTIDKLPDDDHPKFGEHVRAALADLRRLEAITTRAVRGSQSAPEVFRALGAVRRRYHELMTRAATSPGATVGQRLYRTRTAFRLSAAEIALALGAPTELVSSAESEAELSEGSVERIEALIADLGEPAPGEAVR
jgi:transcriptional regulator with XRE-family HTH domain